MRISDWSSDVCSSDLSETSGFADATKFLEGLWFFEGWSSRSSRSSFLPPASREVGVTVGPHAERDRTRMSPVPPWIRLIETRSEEHTSALQSLMRISYAVFCLKKNKRHQQQILTVQADTQTNNDNTTK